jgi:predicted secreted protein
MLWTSIIAIYGLFWVLSAFLVLPFGVRTHDEAGEEMIPGQADSAPVNFNPRRIAKRATLLSLVLFGLYYANYVNGWIGPDDLNFFGKPPEIQRTSQ